MCICSVLRKLYCNTLPETRTLFGAETGLFVKTLLICAVSSTFGNLNTLSALSLLVGVFIGLLSCNSLVFSFFIISSNFVVSTYY